jgi:hypothetical protein
MGCHECGKLLAEAAHDRAPARDRRMGGCKGAIGGLKAQLRLAKFPNENILSSVCLSGDSRRARNSFPVAPRLGAARPLAMALFVDKDNYTPRAGPRLCASAQCMPGGQSIVGMQELASRGARRALQTRMDQRPPKQRRRIDGRSVRRTGRLTFRRARRLTERSAM